MNKLKLEFENPSAVYRGKPFWSWNGKLDKEELIRQIHVMKEMGFGGFFMHSRTGLQTQYLGEEWFECINLCADEVEKLGMEAWLYDEDRWPSGIAGGMVTANPEYRMRSIKLIVEDSEEFTWREDIIAAFACRLEGLNFYDCKKIDGNTPTEAYRGRKILVFLVVEMSGHSFYNGFTYVDTLNRKATERFIELTHEKYRSECGNRLGKSIKGIFTDEPHRGTLMDKFGAGNEEDIWRVPWTKDLPGEFKNKYGYDILDKLPELFLRPEGKTVSQVKWHYVELLQQMFLGNFAKPINDWCNKNNMILTGHVLHEDSLTAQTVMNGSVMRYYEYMSYPGVDVLTEGNNNYWIVKQLSSAARQLGKKMLLSELYGCTGWQMNFESHKAIGDWQALFGINLRCHHLSWYTMEGEAKRDYPASILHQSTWWKEYKYVEDYFSRIGLLMSQGEPCCEVLVLNPVESVWCQIYPGYAQMLGAASPEVVDLEESYRAVFHWLSGAHIDFDYGDEDIISSHYTIEHDFDNKPLLRIGQATYRVVIVGGMLTMRSSTLRILREFIAAGGNVIFAGEPPRYVDAAPAEEVIKLSEKAVGVALEKEALIYAIKDYISYGIEIMNVEGNNLEDIYCQMRRDGVNWCLMLLNINRDKAYNNVNVNIKLQGLVEEYICSTGESYAVNHRDINGCINIQIDFEPCKEHLYMISSKETIQTSPQAHRVEKDTYRLIGPYDYELDELNICVLDMAKYKIDNGDFISEKEILKVDEAVRVIMELPLRGGTMLQPWFAKNGKFEVKCKLALEFEFYIQDIPEDELQLVMETPENFSIAINDHKLKSSITEDFWIDKCFKKLKVSNGFLNKGKNLIQLEVDFHEGINLETIFLIGKFGVSLEGTKKIIRKLPHKINIGDLVSQGLPFYTGKIRYHFQLHKNVNVDERVFISMDRFEGACVKVRSVNNNEKIIAWQPYEADITDILFESNDFQLEVVLTRKNTFGPLHQIPLKALHYGPYSYTTDGEEFSNNYMLIPSGLLKEPYIRIR